MDVVGVVVVVIVVVVGGVVVSSFVIGVVLNRGIEYECSYQL